MEDIAEIQRKMVDEFVLIRKHSRPLGTEVLTECPLLTQKLGNGSSANAAGAILALLNQSKSQVSAKERTPVDVASYILLSRRSGVEARLAQAAEEYRCDERSARRYCDEGFRVLARILTQNAEQTRAECEFFVEVSAIGDQAVSIVAAYTFPEGTVFDSFQIFAGEERIDHRVSFHSRSFPKREGFTEAKTVVSAELTLTRMNGRSIRLGFASLVPLKTVANFGVKNIDAGIRATFMMIEHVTSIYLTMKSVDGAE